MTDTPIDRDDPAVAEAIMRHLCPVANLRTLLLMQLLRSIEIAEAVAPDSWAVTLFPTGFRLNVGQVEVFAFLHGDVHLFLHGAVPATAAKVGSILPSTFRSVPQPQHGFHGSVQHFEHWRTDLQPSHAEFVRAAAVTATGKPRRTGFARFNSPGLYRYAKKVAGA